MVLKNQAVNQFLSAKINWLKYPSLNSFKFNRHKAYLILHVIEQEMGLKHLTASEIAEMISVKFRIKISHQAIRGALNPVIGKEVEVSENDDGELIYSLLPNALTIIGVGNRDIDLNFNPSEILINFDIFKHQKDYIKKILLEINGCYRDCYWNACSTMIRRLFETLIIENYEKNGLQDSIKDDEGDYLKLGKLIKKIINERQIQLSSQTKSHLSKIKLFGDTGAHSRKIILRKHDIEQYRDELRLSAEELVVGLG